MKGSPIRNTRNREIIPSTLFLGVNLENCINRDEEKRKNAIPRKTGRKTESLKKKDINRDTYPRTKRTKSIFLSILLLISIQEIFSNIL